MLRILIAVLLLVCLMPSAAIAASTAEPLPAQVAVNDLDAAYMQPKGVVTTAPEGPAVNAPDDLAGLSVVRRSIGVHLEIDAEDFESAAYFAELADGIHSDARTGLKIGGGTLVAGLVGLAIPTPPTKVAGAIGLIGGGIALIGSGLAEVGAWGLDLTAAVKRVYADRKIIYDE